MISIKSEFNLPLTQELVKLYNIYCQFPFNNIITIPDGFRDNVNLLYKKHDLPEPTTVSNKFTPLSTPINFDNSLIIIGASGGLDSCYTCLKEKDNGRKPILVHFMGIKNYFIKNPMVKTNEYINEV